MKFKVEELNIANAELNITNAELEKIMHANEFLEVCVDKTLIRIYRNNTLNNEEGSLLLINDFIIFEMVSSNISESARIYKLKSQPKECELIINGITIKAMVENCIYINNIGSYIIRSIDKNELFLLQINLDCVKLLTKKQIR